MKTAWKCVWSAALVICLFGLAGGIVIALVGPGHEISWERFDRIQPGMTEADVERILAVPAGDYTTGPILAPSEPDEFGIGGVGKIWLADDSSVFVTLDEQGRVVNASFRTVLPLKQSPWDRLCRLFGR